MSENQFCNPVKFKDGKRHTNPDPFVLRWCGKYYCYSTDAKGVNLSISSDLVNWEYLGLCISEKGYKDYWAPAVIYINGKFYMYYSNIRTDEVEGHNIWLKVAVADNPKGPFIWKKTFFDEFSIDAHPVIWNSQLYMFYSVNNIIGTDEKKAGTIIVMDKMLSPLEFAGERKVVLLPSIEQEIFQKNRFNDGRDWYTLEGAATVVHGDKCFLTYSANAYLNVDYFVGCAVAKVKESLLDMTWKKSPSDYEWKPVLRKNDVVEGTGHNVIVKAPNMVDDWIVYHGRRADEELVVTKEQREMRVDRVLFSGDKMICFGPTQHDVEVPKKAWIQVENIKIISQVFLEINEKCLKAEVWLSAKKQHIGCRYDLYLAYIDERNYVKMELHSGKRNLCIYECIEGIERLIDTINLLKDFIYSVPHLFAIYKTYQNYRILIDDCIKVKFSVSECFNRGFRVGIKPYFTEVMLHSLSIVKTVNLEGNNLAFLREYYDVDKTFIGEEGINSNEDIFILTDKVKNTDFAEEIIFHSEPKVSGLIVAYNEDRRISVKPDREDFSVYRIRCGNVDKLIVDGEVYEDINVQSNFVYKLYLQHLSIKGYIYTES